MKEIPGNIQKRLDEIQKYKNKELEPLKIEYPDIWSLDPKRLFPNSPTLQRYFIELRDKE